MKHDKPPSEGFVPLGEILGGLFALEPAPAPTDKTKPKEKPKKITKALAANTKRQIAAAEIRARPDATEAAYLARELVQCTLPHRDPGAVNGWARRNGNFSLVLQPGIDQKTLQTIGLPYGPLPRLLLLWIATEAIHTQNRYIKLGDTLNDFLREIGLDPKTGGGKRSDAARLKEQLMRLLRCRISFEYKESTRQSWLDMQVAPKGELWWDYHSPDQTPLFESHIVLGEDFFKAITAAPVPIDMRALLPLKKSPLAIDLYTWSTYRLFTMRRSGTRQIKVPLSELKQQFGSEYNRLDNFKTAFSEALEKVQEVFPALDYVWEKNALILRDSLGRPAVASNDKTEAHERLKNQRPFDVVSDKAREAFKRDFPDWDVEIVIADFYLWRQDKGEQSASTDRHFKAFARTWIERNS